MGSTLAPTKDESGDTCVICLSAITERAITSPCNHYTFDFVCLVSWLQQRPTCPLCKYLPSSRLVLGCSLEPGKANVTAVQYDWRSPTDFKSYVVRQGHGLGNAPLSRRPRGSRRAYSPPIEDAALQRRRQVYQRKLYSLHVGSNHFSGYQDLTPQIIATSSELQSRARTWIRRELRVFTFLYSDVPDPSTTATTTSSNAEFLLSYIVSIIQMVDMKASNGHAENLLTEFLGRENSRLFLHELQAWLRSPYMRLQEWDREVQYGKERV
jgi:hypothetical protein